VGSLILAFRFLTIAPVPGREATGAGALGRAAWWFPVVGLVLGAALAVADRALAQIFPLTLAAVLTLTLWKLATGGLHLDGLADCLDGLGGRDREQRRAIMRDSRIGVFGAAGLMLCLLIGLAALTAVPPDRRWAALVAAPTLGRMAPALAGACFPAATPGEGSGAGFLAGLSPWTGPVQLLLAVILLPLLLGPRGGIVLGAAALGGLGWSGLLARRLGGLTGDVLGGAVEVSELAVLLAFAALAHHRWI